MESSSLCSSPGFCPPRRLLPAAAVVPEIPRKAAAGCERKLTLSFLPCAEFSFPGPDDSSWGKYEETLAESHDGSEGEESMEAPSTCELETSPRWSGRGAERGGLGLLALVGDIPRVRPCRHRGLCQLLLGLSVELDLSPCRRMGTGAGGALKHN